MKFNLSGEARRAHESEGSVLVLGGPGSGKTTLALLKAQRLIPTLGPGQEVLFLSFSRAAVHQVTLRCKDVLSTDDRRLIAAKTYHAFCMELLKSHGRLLTGQPVRVLYPRQAQIRRARFGEGWAEEEVRLAKEGLYSFDQLAPSAAQLLELATCVRELISDRYPVIILDEFQDTNDSQWAFVRQLARGSRTIVLADPDQRIFEYDVTVDPRRLDQLREVVSPAEFDLAGDNHRSPNGGILSFADALLRNQPLPKVPEVNVISVWPRSFDATVHAGLIWMLGNLRKAGVSQPSVAVLARTNPMVASLSAVFDVEHQYRGRTIAPVSHSVTWDAELAASSAAVVASILEWPQYPSDVAGVRTLRAISDFYEMKFALGSAKSARADADRYAKAALSIEEGKGPRAQAIKNLVEASDTGIKITGDPIEDWKTAQAVLRSCSIDEVHRNARFVRLFRASGEIGPGLAQQWADNLNYGAAQEIVRRAIDRARLSAAASDHRGVVLMTMHKSKGKEFDGVLVVEGSHRGTFFDTRKEEPPYVASRRLLRVGITRARTRVMVVRSQQSLPLTGVYS